MKTLGMTRHGQSGYNARQGLKEAHELYGVLKSAYKDRKTQPEVAREVAAQFLSEGPPVLTVSDRETPLTDLGREQSVRTGRRLPGFIALPQVIVVSPYRRPKQTLEGLIEGWPELGSVKVIEDERVRELEHGDATKYNDWRVFHLLNPEEHEAQKRLGRYYYRYPGGENIPDLRARSREALDDVSALYEEVFVVGHHLQKLAWLAEIYDWDAHKFMQMNTQEKPVNCGVTISRADTHGRLALEAYNMQLY